MPSSSSLASSASFTSSRLKHGRSEDVAAGDSPVVAQDGLQRWRFQPGARTASSKTFRIGCFNIGIRQDMLKTYKHMYNVRRILGRGFCEGNLHMIGLCEVGGHKQWLKTADINPQ